MAFIDTITSTWNNIFGRKPSSTVSSASTYDVTPSLPGIGKLTPAAPPPPQPGPVLEQYRSSITPPTMASLAPSQGSNEASEFIKYMEERRRLDNQILQASLNQAPKPPPIPEFDVDGAFKKAREQAKSSVSPYYEKVLSSFKDELVNKRTQLREDVNTLADRTAEDIRLAEEEAKLEEGRTREDLTSTLDNFDATQSEANAANAFGFNRALRAVGQNLGQSNLTFSGIGQQNVDETLDINRTQEAARDRQIEGGRQSAQRVADRRISDLATAVKSTKIKGERITRDARVNFEREFGDILSEELGGRSASQLTEKTRDVEFQREADIIDKSGTYYQDIFRQFLGGIDNPEVRERASQVYG